MGFRAAIAFLGFVALIPSVRADGMAPIFGPKSYARTTGKPNSFTDVFQNCEPLGQYNLVVQNGNPGGSNRASAASIMVNGAAVVLPSDFNQSISTIIKPLILARKNVIDVSLASKPGSSITVTVECASSCLGITITSPISGGAVNQSPIIVSGTVSSSADEIGVTVNGTTSQLQGLQFSAAGTPVVLGSNQLTATVTNACGNQATATELVTATAVTPPSITFRVVPPTGVAPLSVTISSDVGSANPIVNYQWDFNGDGTVDASGPSLASATTTYSQPGLYLVQLTVTDSQGNDLSGQVPIAVFSQATLVALLQNRWSGFKSALVDQDIAGALGLVETGFAGQYDKALSSLGTQLPTIASSFGNITFVSAVGGIVEFVTTRTQHGTSFAYFIYFMQDSNGLWKIVSM
jgi:hypothetical protein